MRIVGGIHKGKKLFTPKSPNTRPTTDRVREAIFNTLTHGLKNAADEFEINNANVLDLFAGTGALGLEALSRGAKFAVFVEEAIEPRGLIRSNIEHLQMTGTTKLFRRDATSLGSMKRFEPFHLVFIDPPYNKGLGERALNSAIKGNWLANNAIIVLEEAISAEIIWPETVTPLENRTYGDTMIHYAIFSSEQVT